MIIGHILGLYRDNGKGNGNYSLGFRIEGLCRVHIGITENGSYYNMIGYIRGFKKGFRGIMQRKMEANIWPKSK